MISENVEKFLKEMPVKNPFGETVRLVAAVKTQSVEAINEAIAAGITMIGDNHAQEFRDKYEGICGSPQRHFIGRMQTNKLKYLVGRCDLYQSVDRLSIAEALSSKSASSGVTSDILIEINPGGEESKGGFKPSEAAYACAEICKMPSLRICGLMAMLPESEDEAYLRSLARDMRALYDGLRAQYKDFRYLSMGMSGDWKLCVECGSNMIRIGTALFGKRNYN